MMCGTLARRGGWMLGMACGLLLGSWAQAQTTVTTNGDTQVKTTVTVETVRTIPAAPEQPKVRTAAIFVKNSAGPKLEEQVRAMEDLVSAKVSDLGISVIAREEVANSVGQLAQQGPNAGRADLAGAELDALLSNQTSALRLAQNLGADYVLVVSMSTYSQARKNFKGYGVETEVLESKLRVSYKLLDKYVGGSLTGDTVEATARTQASANSNETLAGITDLMDACAQKLAENLQRKIEENKIRERSGDMATAGVEIVCGVQGMTVPNIVKNEKGEYMVSSETLKLEATNVTVELNGVVIGTAPGVFQIPKGLNKMRLRREGCRDFEGTVSASGGQRMIFDLALSDAGYARWKDMTAFLAILKTNEKLTDAQVKVLEGYAQMLRQSGYKVDVKHDHKSDIKEDHKSDVKIDSDLKGTTFQTINKQTFW